MKKQTAKKATQKLKSLNSGDYVEVHLMKKIYEGILLEIPETEKGIVLLKLDSGYNIGFSKKDVLKIKLLKATNYVNF